MKKFNILFILGIFLILTSFSVNAVPSGGLSYFNFNNTVDEWFGIIATNNGADTSLLYPTFNTSGDSSPSSFDFVKTNSDYLTYSDSSYPSGSSARTVSLWFYADRLPNAGEWFGLFGYGTWAPTPGYRFFGLSIDQNAGINPRKICISIYTEDQCTTNIAVAGQWNHLVVSLTGTSANFYVNGVADGSPTFTNTPNTVKTGTAYIGSYPGLNYFEGKIDEVKVFDYVLNSTERSNLFNYGNIEGTPPATNFSIISKSNYSIDPINNFSALITDGVSYNKSFNTTTGTIITDILDNDTTLYNIEISSANWFTKNYYNVSVTSTLTTYLKQSDISFACNQKITGNSLTCLNSTIYPDADTYNFTIGVSGYYNITQEETINALDNKTINFNGFYSSNLTFYNNFLSGPGDGLTSCNYTVQGITYPAYNEIVSGVNGSSVGLINGSYNITADCDGYAYSYETVIIENITKSVTFDLYTTNSIDISIFDETTGASLNGTNITVTKILGSVQQVNITSTGTISYEELTAGNYTFNFEGDDYPARSYNVEIGNKTYQTLSVYLLANTTDKVIFTFQEYNNNLVIEGVTLQISKIINGTDTLIAVLNSDITGRTQFYFDTTERYCFVASKTSFTTKSWCLDPIIFTSYLIKLETSVSLSTGDDYEEILIDWTPKTFWNNVNNTISFTFANPQGSLTNYGFNATLDNGTSVSASGTNAYGSVLSKELEILNSQYGDKVTVYYFYKKTGDSEYRTFKLIYDIYGYNATTDSLLDNPPDDYGLGEFEKTLISVSIAVLVGGAGASFGGPVAGGVMALFMFAWLMYIAFLNFWVGIISIILLFVVVSWRSSQ